MRLLPLVLQLHQLHQLPLLRQLLLQQLNQPRKRQSLLARSLIQLQPGLKHDGAVSILIDALENAEAETAKTVHEELVRLTGQDFGLEAHRWRQWLH